MVRAPNGEEYIIRGYMDDMAGLVIPDNWVVKADNGRYWQFERSDLGAKSTNHCPTYGNCFDCFSSGPTGLHCQNCRVPNRYYHVMLYEEKILDATWLSRLFEATHMQAMADRTWNRRRVPTFSLRDRAIIRRLEYKYLDRQDSALLIKQDLNHFRFGLIAKGYGAWDCLDRRGRVTFKSENVNVYNGN